MYYRKRRLDVDQTGHLHRHPKCYVFKIAIGNLANYTLVEGVPPSVCLWEDVSLEELKIEKEKHH